MYVYKYDGSFNGFLSAVFDIYTSKRLPDLITASEAFQLGLDSEIIQVQTDVIKANRIKKGIERHIGGSGIHGLEYAFSSCECNKEMKIFAYIRLVFKHENIVLHMLSNPAVIDYNMIVDRVLHEIDRIKGFLRFKQLSNGIFLASYTPDNNITRFILPYFAARNNEMSFIIHDKSRNLMGIYNGEESDIIFCDQKLPEIFTEEEAYCQKMWQQYFNTVNIASRKNKRLQDNYMPLRYRKNMSEFQQL